MLNLKKLREEKALSQQRLADLFNLSQQSIYKYENAISEPDIETLKKLANFFDTSIDYLVGHTNIRHKIEPVERCDLNNQELEHMDKIRALPVTVRTKLDSLIDVFITTS